MNGSNYLAGSFIRPEGDTGFKLAGQDLSVASWRHAEIYPALSAAIAPDRRVTLSYRLKPHGSNGVTIRRREGTGAWPAQPLAAAWHGTNYHDQAPLQPRVRYEYEVVREGHRDFTDHPKIFAGVDLPPVEDRGRILLLVDRELQDRLEESGALRKLKRNLVGDGWKVIQRGTDGTVSSPRHNDIGTTAANELNRANMTKIKEVIETAANEPESLKGIIVLGHVTIQYAGASSPDGHDLSHGPAWPADLYLGDRDGAWTDDRDFHGGDRPENRNIQGDGKWDQDQLPGPVELFVGRIDFARCNTLTGGTREGEAKLIERYIDKTSAYRHGETTLMPRGIAYGTWNFGAANSHVTDVRNTSLYSNACRIMSALCGMACENIPFGDPFHQRSEGYTWGFYSGDGGLDAISQGVPQTTSSEGTYLQHRTADLANSSKEPNEPKIAFYLLLGSYFGDWNMPENFMRACLSTERYGYAAMWISPRPTWDITDWQFQGMALGDTLGDCLLKTVNDKAGDSNDWDSSRERAILGDPTLRLHILEPPSEVGADLDPANNRALIRWKADPGEQFYVYKAPSLFSGFSRISPVPVTGSSVDPGSYSFTDSSAAGPGVYMVRTVKTVTTGCGSYVNLSQGIFWPADSP
jgi:hypothetical protein